MNVEPVQLDGWDRCGRAFAGVIGYEAWKSDAELLAVPGGVHDYVGDRLRACAAITEDVYDECLRGMSEWREEVLSLLERVRSSGAADAGAAAGRGRRAVPAELAGVSLERRGQCLPCRSLCRAGPGPAFN